MASDNRQKQNHNLGHQGQADDSAGKDEPARPPTMLQVIQSTLAAAFGVQSEKARLRDFKHGRPLPFIIAGVVFTIVFIVILVVVVNVVLRSAGA